MLEERGVVTEVEGDYAFVETAIKSTCSGCSTSSCGTGALASYFSNRSSTLKVHNSQHAKKGDTVVIGIDENSMLIASFLVYMLPLITLFIGGYLGELGGKDTMISEWLSILGGVLGFIFGFIWARKIGQKQKAKNKLEAVMLRCESAQPIQFNY